MSVNELAIEEKETIEVLHPATDSVLKVELYKACSLKFNSRLAALGYSDNDDLDKKVINSAVAAFVKIDGYDSDGNEFLTKPSFSWLALAIFLHINKKKVNSSTASNS